MSPLHLRLACLALLLLVAGPILFLTWDAGAAAARIVEHLPADAADAARLIFSETETLRWHSAGLFLVATTIASVLVFIVLRRSTARPDYETLLEQAAHGDFGSLPDDGSDFARAWNRVAAMIDTRFASLVSELDEMSDVVADLRNAAEKASRGSDEAVGQVSDARSATGHVANSAESVIASLPAWESTAREILDAVAGTAETARSGLELAVRVQNHVGRFDRSSREIDGIVESITKIASKTNHLALNATIEAAGAGDAGRGFAIVADEVRDLARRSASATEQMRAKLGAFRDEATTAVKDIVDVGTVIRHVDEAQDSLRARISRQEQTAGQIVPVALSMAEGSDAADHAIRAVGETIETIHRHSDAALQQTEQLQQRLEALKGMLRPHRSAG